MMKKAGQWIALVSIFLVLFTFAAFAQTERRVFDHAGLLSDTEIANLEQRIQSFQQKHGMDAVILTLDNAEGKSARDYADDFYDENHFGFGTEYDGLLFLIDMDNREIYISTSGKMIDLLTDYRIDRILDGQFDHVVDGKFYQAFVYGLSATESYIQSGPVPGQYRIDENELAPYGRVRQRKGLTPLWVLISLAASLGIGAITMFSVSAYYKKDFHKVAYDYRTNSNLALAQKNDILVNSYVTTRRIETNTSSSGGSSSTTRSTTHSSSSGRTHGGGGRKF